MGSSGGIGVLFFIGFVYLVIQFTKKNTKGKKRSDFKTLDGDKYKGGFDSSMWIEVTLKDGSKHYVPKGYDLSQLDLETSKEVVPQYDVIGVYEKKNLLTKAEYSFWKTLKEKCGDEFIICPKVRMEDFLNIKAKGSYGELQRYRGYIKSRHIDFMLCDASLRIVAGIELDDNSHKSKDIEKTDALKNDVFTSIGLPLYRISMSRGYYDRQIEEMLKSIRNNGQQTQ